MIALQEVEFRGVCRRTVEFAMQGLIVNGCIRDSEDIGRMDLGVKALATYPLKSSKRDPGLRDVPVTFAGACDCTHAFTLVRAACSACDKLACPDYLAYAHQRRFEREDVVRQSCVGCCGYGQGPDGMHMPDCFFFICRGTSEPWRLGLCRQGRRAGRARRAQVVKRRMVQQQLVHYDEQSETGCETRRSRGIRSAP